MSGAPDIDAITRRHLLFGWWALMVFLLVGSALETMHGFKVAWYVDVATETRRLVWRLGHAHGTMLSIINIVFALTLRASADRIGADEAWPQRASKLLLVGTVLLPGGFFAGGLVIYGGDPGPGVFVAPFGALALALAVLLTGVGLHRALKD